jgi:hypothetical protein
VITDGDAEEVSIQKIERCRRLFRRAAVMMEAHGVRLEDVAIAASFASEDIAARHKGGHHAAIEWLRTALDLQERQLLDASGMRS